MEKENNIYKVERKKGMDLFKDIMYTLPRKEINEEKLEEKMECVVRVLGERWL